MTKILFIQLHAWQQLGLMYISAKLKKHSYNVRLAIGATFNEILPSLNEFNPDVVGFSIITGDQTYALEIARKIKQRFNVKTLFGGPHATYFPEFIHQEGVDALIRGEGETACLEFMEYVAGIRPISSVRNLWSKTGSTILKNEFAPFDDINSLEFPDRTIYDDFKEKVDCSSLYVVTSRNCPYNCSFCYNSRLREIYKGKDKYVRIRSHDNVLEEIRQGRDVNNKITSIHFVDDIFGVNEKWLHDFLPKFKRQIGLPFDCLVRADVIARHPDYAAQLKSAGCAGVAFGIESGNERLRQTVLRKQITDEEIIKTADILHNAGLTFKTYNIFGFPNESIKNAEETVELNINIKTDFPSSNLFIPYPMLDLTEEARQKGYLPKCFSVADIKNDAFVNSQLQMPNIIVFEKLNRFFQTVVLMPFLWPLIKFYCNRPPPYYKFTKRMEIFWFGMIYFYVYYKSTDVNIVKLIFYALKNYKKILGFSKKDK